MWSGYADDPIRPVSSLIRNLRSRDLQAVVHLAVIRNCFQTLVPRVLPQAVAWRLWVDLGVTSRDYRTGHVALTIEDTYSDKESGAHKND